MKKWMASNNLKAQRDYDITTRLLVHDGKEKELKGKIDEIKANFCFEWTNLTELHFTKLPIVPSTMKHGKSLSIKKPIGQTYIWSHAFGCSASYLSKFTNDVKSSEAAVTNYLASKWSLTQRLF